MSEQKKIKYVYFVSFSYLNLVNQIRMGRLQLNMEWPVDNMVRVNEMENKIRESMFNPNNEVFGIKYEPACQGDPFSIAILNYQLLKIEKI